MSSRKYCRCDRIGANVLQVCDKFLGCKIGVSVVGAFQRIRNTRMSVCVYTDTHIFTYCKWGGRGREREERKKERKREREREKREYE